MQKVNASVLIPVFFQKIKTKSTNLIFFLHDWLFYHSFACQRDTVAICQLAINVCMFHKKAI